MKKMFSLNKLLSTAVVVTALSAVPLSAKAAPSLCDSVSGNLIQNCGFETGDFTDWAVTGNHTFVASNFDEGPNSGNDFAALGEVGLPLSTLSQTVSDTAGASYTLSYWFASDGGEPNYFEADWNGSTIAGSVENAVPAFGYEEFSFTVVGTGSDTLTFLSRNDPSYQALDDVSLATVPEPVTASLFGAGLLGLGLARRKSGGRR